jgi:hypothetical protein
LGIYAWKGHCHAVDGESPRTIRTARQARAAIAAIHPDLPGRWCGLSAELTIHAGDTGDAATLLLALGRRSVASGALTTAAAVLDHAATFTSVSAETGRAVAGLRVEVAARTGDVDQAFIVGQALVARTADPGERAHVHLRLNEAAITATSWDAAQQQLATRSRLVGDRGHLPRSRS